MKIRTPFLAAVLALTSGIWLYAQSSAPASSGMQSSGMQMQHAKASAPAGPSAIPNAPNIPTVMDDSNSIFCGSMHTGQLCSLGTTHVLKVSPDKQDAWIQAARKYNRAVEAATQQLFKDADGTLSPDQMERLKAWFAQGINPEINRLLYAKGLGAAN